jgi:hypothetical protein
LKRKKTSRLGWSRLYVPPELADLIFMVAKKEGYEPDDVHLFIYRMLKEVHSEDVDSLADYLNTRWLDKK